MSISSTIRAGAAYVEVTAETSKLQRNLTKAQAQLQSFGRSCTSVGKDLLMVSATMALPLGLAVKGFADFDDQMRLAKAVTRATAAEFDSMTKVAAKLGRETSFTAKQVADGMVALGRMGFSPKEVEQAIQPTLDLARATGTELGEAADIAANSMRIFGIEASKMSSVADVLTATANGSAQTLTDLFEALKMAGPQAKAAGENIVDTNAAIGILANLGIKGSLAGTALRKSFSQFAKVKVQDQLKAVGVETVDANGNLRKMADIMADIGRVMNTLPTAERIAFAEDIFDIRGSLAGLSLGGNIKEFEEFIVKLQDIDGTARKTAEEMDAGLGGSFRMLLSAVEGAMNAIAKALEGTLQPLVDKLTAVTLAVIGWIEANSGLVTAFAVTVAGAAALGVALITIGVAAKGGAAGITVAHTALKSFTFIQGVCIAQGSAIRNSILLIGQAFANYRNTAIPALVGTEKLCAAFGLASTAANRSRAAIVLMSNAEAAAAAKSFLAAKWTAMTIALKGFSQTAVVAAIATKAQAAAELMASAKTALAARWIAMTEALKSLTLASVSATVATKAQAAAEIVAGAKNALVAGWVAMTNALKGLTVASVAATVATKAQGAAEMAMAAKGAIVAGWLAMTKAIQGVTIATVAATVATYAHTAAEAICTAGTVALNNARKVAIATTALFSAVNLKAAISITAVAVGNFLLAAAAKVAAVAMAVLSAVMTAVAAHPVAAALIALGLVLAGVVICLSRAGSYTAKLSDKMSELREKEDQLRKTDEVRMERLQQLASKQRLTNAEMAEAKKLARDLQAKYGDLGITISDNAARIVALDTAASQLGAVELKVTNADDLEKVARLKDLSLRVNMNTEEQTEAAGLLEDLSARYGDLGIEIDRVRGRMVALNDAAKRIQGVKLGVKIEADDLPKFDKLKTLSMELNLTVPQQGDAERLITELSKKYGDLGLTVNRTTGQIERLNTVAGAISDLTFKVRGSEDIEKLNQLKALSLEANLEVQGQEDAGRLISELESKYGTLGITVDKVSGKIAAMNAESARIGALELSVKDNDDLAKLQKLKALSLEVRLDVDRQNEADKLIGDLSKKYGDLGVTVDRTAGKITRLNSVAASIREISVKVTGAEDAGKVARLQELSARPKLDNSGVAEANALIDQLKAKYGELGVGVDAAAGQIVAMTDAQRQFAAAQQLIQAGNDPLKETHLARLDRLQKLAAQEKLTADEQIEAQNIVNALNGAYGSLGLGIDTITGKLNMAAGAQQKLNDAMKAATLAELDAEMAEVQANLKELEKENEALMSYWNHNLWSQISGRQAEAIGKIETNGDRAVAYRKKLGALRQRRSAVEQEKPGANTGTDGKPTPTTAENVEAEKQRRQKASDDADSAAKRVAEIDKQLARERKTELENELDDIISLRDEYKRLIQTMLDFEKSKPEGEQDKKKIAELEGKLADADKVAEERIAKAKAKAAEKMKKDVADYQRRFADSEKDVQSRRAEDAQDRKLDETLKADPEAGRKMAQGLVAQYQQAAAAAKAQFEQELQATQADGKIDDEEHRKIDAAQEAYTRAESMVDKYSGKLQDAQDGAQKAADNSQVNGSFLASALDAMLGGGGTEAERTAKATESMAAQSKETNKLLKKIEHNAGGITYK